MLREFKNFILRGNVLDLAVGVIIGSAFTGLVTSLVNNLINALIGMFVQSTALANFYFYIDKIKFTYGAFLNDTINFVITAFVVFIIIKLNYCNVIIMSFLHSLVNNYAHRRFLVSTSHNI